MKRGVFGRTFIKNLCCRRKILTKIFALVFLSSVLIASILSAGAASAGIPDDVARLFELNSKIRPGMTIDAINVLLDFPAREDRIGDTTESSAVPITRCMWLHGEMGVEVYALEGSAYSVSITLPCKNAPDALKAMDALTRQGSSKYGYMPQFDRASSEYYWVRDGIRFAFSKYNKTTVLTRCTETR